MDLQTTIERFLRVFSLFGLVQVRIGVENQVEVVRKSTWIIPILLLIYMVNAVVVFCYERPSTDTISLVSNVIQMTLSSILISVALILPVKYMELARKTIRQIQALGDELESTRVHINYRSVCRSFCLIMTAFSATILYFISYDAYVNLVKGSMTLKYWFLSILPPVYMILIMAQAICALALAQCFYKRVNRVIAAQIPSPEFEEDSLDKSPFKLENHKEILDFGYPNKDNKALFPKLFQVLGGLNELCQKLETYYGPLFLASFTTIFVVTSIQLYYCYQIITQEQDESRGYSYWTMVVSLNVVIINVILVISITALCQAITNQVSLLFLK